MAHPTETKKLIKWKPVYITHQCLSFTEIINTLTGESWWSSLLCLLPKAEEHTENFSQEKQTTFHRKNKQINNQQITYFANTYRFLDAK
jgi:hypothetical protein